MSVTTLEPTTKKMVVPEITIVVTPIKKEKDPDTCYIDGCNNKVYDNCFVCEKPTCEEHMISNRHYCGWTSNHCPNPKCREDM